MSTHSDNRQKNRLRASASSAVLSVTVGWLFWQGCQGGADGVDAAKDGGGTSGASQAGGKVDQGGGGFPGTGGVAGTGGTTAPASGGRTGAGGGAIANLGCKRGIATNIAPGAAFVPAVAWWYSWSAQASGGNTGIEFVPMLWGSGSLNTPIPDAAKYLLAFNEPNFKVQANLTPAQAASNWPTVEIKAAGRPIVSPGMNYCGPAASCNGTDPYQYLTDFFAACADCAVDYVAVHWYNCDLPSLRDYLEPGNNLPGFEQFGRPIWLTEFSCDGNASAASQEAYMRVAIPYLEANPKVFRYSWFSADPIPSARLMNPDGTPTALGKVYINLPQTCQP